MDDLSSPSGKPKPVKLKRTRLSSGRGSASSKSETLDDSSESGIKETRVITLGSSKTKLVSASYDEDDDSDDKLIIEETDFTFESKSKQPREKREGRMAKYDEEGHKYDKHHSLHGKLKHAVDKKEPRRREYGDITDKSKTESKHGEEYKERNIKSQGDRESEKREYDDNEMGKSSVDEKYLSKTSQSKHTRERSSSKLESEKVKVDEQNYHFVKQDRDRREAIKSKYEEEEMGVLDGGKYITHKSKHLHKRNGSEENKDDTKKVNKHELTGFKSSKQTHEQRESSTKDGDEEKLIIYEEEPASVHKSKQPIERRGSIKEEDIVYFERVKEDKNSRRTVDDEKHSTRHRVKEHVEWKDLDVTETKKDAKHAKGKEKIEGKSDVKLTDKEDVKEAVKDLCMDITHGKGSSSGPAQSLDEETSKLVDELFMEFLADKMDLIEKDHKDKKKKKKKDKDKDRKSKDRVDKHARSHGHSDNEDWEVFEHRGKVEDDRSSDKSHKKKKKKDHKSRDHDSKSSNGHSKKDKEEKSKESITKGRNYRNKDRWRSKSRSKSPSHSPDISRSRSRSRDRNIYRDQKDRKWDSRDRHDSHQRSKERQSGRSLKDQKYKDSKSHKDVDHKGKDSDTKLQKDMKLDSKGSKEDDYEQKLKSYMEPYKKDETSERDSGIKTKDKRSEHGVEPFFSSSQKMTHSHDENVKERDLDARKEPGDGVFIGKTSGADGTTNKSNVTIETPRLFNPNENSLDSLTENKNSCDAENNLQHFVIDVTNMDIPLPKKKESDVANIFEVVNNDAETGKKVAKALDTAISSLRRSSTEDKSNDGADLKEKQEDSQKGKKPQIKLGIKISETSAALISSGVKIENDPKKANREEGEISDSSANGSSSSDTDDELEDTDGSVNSGDGSVKKRKKKQKHKHKKKKKHRSSKEKENDSTKRKHSRSTRSRSPKKHKHSRSRSRSKSFDEVNGVWKTHGRRSRSRSRERRLKRRSRSRSWERAREAELNRIKERERNRFYRGWRRSRSRERDRQKPSQEDLRLKIDKAKLREIAIANAYANMQAGQGPTFTLKAEQVATLKAGGRSVEELTDFCKKISEKEANMSSSDESEMNRPMGSDDEDAPFIHHPFKVREHQPNIVMNIRNAKQLPILTPQEKVTANSQLRLTFPVSSGSHHRAHENEWVPVTKDKTAGSGSMPAVSVADMPSTDSAATSRAVVPLSTSATVPSSSVPQGVAASESTTAGQKIFPDPPEAPIDIGSVVSERLTAMRKLQDNPHDVEAISKMYKAQQQMNAWAESKNLPGQFTGSTGVQVLSQAELAGVDPKRQAWIKKDVFSKAQPVKGGIGMFLLQKMGWKQGEGLGKNNEGQKEPLMLDFKIDRKGLTSQDEKGGGPVRPVRQPPIRDLSGKHPVSALVELCSKRKWGVPEFTMMHESGPDHKKNFVFKVKVNGVEYQPSIASSNKKHARAQAATLALQELGLVPRDDP